MQTLRFGFFAVVAWLGGAWTPVCAQSQTTPPPLKPNTQITPPPLKPNTQMAAPPLNSVTQTTPPLSPKPTTQPTSQKADAFAVGVQHCRDSEWEKALSFFLMQKRRSLLELSLPDRVRLFAFLGVIYANLLQSVESRDAFEKALLLDPCARLPALRSIAPQIRVAFASVQSGFARACARQIQEQAQVLARKHRPKTPLESNPPPQKALIDPILRPSKAMHLSAWIVTAVGGAALAVGCTFGGLALLDDVQRQQSPYTLDGTQQYLRLAQQAQERAWTANVLYGVAGALLFTGFALHISKWVQESTASSERTLSSPQPQTVLYGTHEKPRTVLYGSH
ncbi:hypothetical protein L6R29_16470 [Myxococcota bacterium]|nr:hypothetical protein [Myxococcota bacterium]